VAVNVDELLDIAVGATSIPIFIEIESAPHTDLTVNLAIPSSDA
jgi:hypothetical protein